MDSKKPALTICMPVYNFGSFLAETLNSILAAADGLSSELEILIVDGASTDNTSDVVASYEHAHRAVRYIRLPQKGGIDRDMATAVSLAAGEYVWLFSGDDLMCPIALKRALHRINGGADLYLCKHAECRPHMVPFLDWPVMINDAECVLDLSDPRQRRMYFSNASNTEAFFSFMGNIIVKRAAWARGRLEENFIGSCFCHSARLMRLMKEELTVHYIPEIWLHRRPDNDSFMSAGLVQRFRLPIHWFPEIADTIFGARSAEAFHVRRAVRNEFPLFQLLYLRYMCALHPDREDRNLLDSLVRKAHPWRSLKSLKTRLAYSFYDDDWFRHVAADLCARLESEKYVNAPT